MPGGKKKAAKSREKTRLQHDSLVEERPAANQPSRERCELLDPQKDGGVDADGVDVVLKAPLEAERNGQQSAVVPSVRCPPATTMPCSTSPYSWRCFAKSSERSSDLKRWQHA